MSEPLGILRDIPPLAEKKNIFPLFVTHERSYTKNTPIRKTQVKHNCFGHSKLSTLLKNYSISFTGVTL